MVSVAREKIREALVRLAVEQPEADLSVETAETREAEDALNESIVKCGRGDCGLDDVRTAYRRWLEVQLEAGKPKLLFELR